MHSVLAFSSALPLSSRPFSPSLSLQCKSKLPFTPTFSSRRSTVRMTATNPDDKILQGPIAGRYGEWYLRQSDANGVQTYRLSLTVMCACYTLSALLSQTNPPPFIYDALYFTQLAAFGVALQTIHIYAKPLHQALKALWTLSLLGSIALEFTMPGAIVQGVYENPMLLLAVGWQFVALTGLFIKEAFCFQRVEAISLIALVPILSAGHFFQLLGPQIERGGVLLLVGLFAFFCARKFGQSAVDDIGDMTVFEHLAKGGSL